MATEDEGDDTTGEVLVSAGQLLNRDVDAGLLRDLASYAVLDAARPILRKD